MTMADLIINDENFQDYLEPTVNGEAVGRGYVERDLERQPLCSSPGAYSAVDMVVYPRSEWDARIKEKDETKSRLSDIRRMAANGQHMPSLYQGQSNFCWVYSTAGCVMLQRAVMNLPYVRLSPHALGCKIQNYRNQGGWSPLSMEWFVKVGCPSIEFWPERSFSRSNDTAKTWENAKHYQVTEGWWDLSQNIYNRNLTFDQVATLLLSNVPCTLDYNWWGHSVLGLDLVRIEAGSYGIRILNSWSDQWGDKGEAILQGRKAIPDGSVAPRVVDASVLAA
jgi:hypothetical protein